MEGGTKDTKGTKGMLPHWGNEEVHKTTDPLTEPLHQEGHVLNVDKWVISPGTAQGKESEKASTSSIAKMTTLSLSH